MVFSFKRTEQRRKFMSNSVHFLHIMSFSYAENILGNMISGASSLRQSPVEPHQAKVQYFLSATRSL